MKPETQRDPGRAPRPAFLAELFESLTDRTRRLWGRSGAESPAVEAPDLSELGEALLSRRGEASGVAIARATSSTASSTRRCSPTIRSASRKRP